MLFLDKNPITGMRGSLFYRSYEPGTPAYRGWRYGIDFGWGRLVLSAAADGWRWLRGRLKPPAIQTPEGPVGRGDTLAGFIGSLAALDALPGPEPARKA